MDELHRPGRLRLRLLPWALAALAALGAQVAVRSCGVAAEDPAVWLVGGPEAHPYAIAAERGWIEEALPPRWLLAAPAALPCPEGLQRVAPAIRREVEAAIAEARAGEREAALRRLDDLRERPEAGWLPGLTLALLRLEAGRFADAEVVLEDLVESRWSRATAQDALIAARGGWPDSGPPSDEVLAAIQLLHAYGYVLLQGNHQGEEFWQALRNPIGAAKLVALRGETRVDGPREAPTWADHRVPAPGCDPSTASISTLDLFNQLIVGYLTREQFADPGRRQAELDRDYRDPPDRNPLLAVMRSPGELAEHRLWALSNAERLLTQRRRSSLGPVTEPHLALNLAQLLRGLVDHAEPAVAVALRAEAARQTAAALAARAGLGDTAREDVDPVLLAQLLHTAVDRGEQPDVPRDLVARLDSAVGDVVAAVGASVGARRDPAAWIALLGGPIGGEDPLDDAGGRRREIRRAARRDAAAALARRGAGGDRAERSVWARRAATVLHAGDERPEVLLELERDLPWWWRWSPRTVLARPVTLWVLTAGGGVLGFLLGAWLALQLRRRRDLFTSFYRLEAEHRFGRRD